ncbi:hypothetical protein GQ44DRAFT_726850 [Phaeosphaeriaceae sp. PMI808]|nr:hypothetical protein GQ44DRAFT_726850 [Phaeosphaeriaceae sp. PMI808]
MRLPGGSQSRILDQYVMRLKRDFTHYAQSKNGNKPIVVQTTAMRCHCSLVGSTPVRLCAFAKVLQTFREAAAGTELMVTARIESFTSRVIHKDAVEERQLVMNAHRGALARATLYTAVGADAIMIHRPTSEAVGRVSDGLLFAENGLFAPGDDEDLTAAAAARNFGCLLRRLAERNNAGLEEEEAAMLYRRIMSKLAAETMGAVVKRLTLSELSGCEVDDLIILVKDLLKINAHQVSQIV